MAGSTPRTFRTGFALTVRALRAERGWNQRELCRRADLSPAYLSELENGRKDPSAEMMERLAEAFGQSVDQFLWSILIAMRRGEIPGVHRRESALRIAMESLLLSPQGRMDVEEFLEFQQWRARSPERGTRNKRESQIVDDTEPDRLKLTED
jgi:transcriptional regulator with XRE-family HTH domain